MMAREEEKGEIGTHTGSISEPSFDFTFREWRYVCVYIYIHAHIYVYTYRNQL